MKPPSKAPVGRGQSLRLAALGLEFISTIIGLLIFGYYLDLHFHCSPVFGAIGLVLGTSLGIYRLASGLRQLDDKPDR